MVVVSPFCEVIGEFMTRQVCSGVFEIDDYELFVLVGWFEQRRFVVIKTNSKDIAILCLDIVSLECR